MQVTMDDADFNFPIFFLKTRRNFHFLVSIGKGLSVIYCCSEEESKHTRTECFVTHYEVFVSNQSPTYTFSSLKWFIIAIKFERKF